MRVFFAAPALACAALLAYGYYLQYFDNQDPCPLCLL
ncbi:MAG: disulfide bond formation protein B, partial [Betaproteobacteria bacterium]|nr:disulfide bond formation protein B [Betaproteobacteria bacterium]